MEPRRTDRGVGLARCGRCSHLDVIAKDSTGTAVPGAIVFLSLTSTASTPGTAKATDQNSQVVKTLTTTPKTFFADSNGAVPITYTTATPLPTGGTDTITAQDRGSSPTISSTDTYTFAGSPPPPPPPPPFAPQGVGAPSVAIAPDGTQLIFWQGAGGHLDEVWWQGHWNGPVDWSS